ncbi:unnamed protein product [Mycena citricolor]|uniref:Uncharacterized protein n=1 Tax=Mycena citricolor TaxID=2018698 RepID=A0AAD2HG28_9AGAR|nr:unnamed protein product [Mycena citricolor]
MTTEEYGSLVPAVCVNLLLYTLEFVMACVFLSRRAKEGLPVASSSTFGKTLTGVLFSTLFPACGLTHYAGDNDEVQGRFWKLLIGTLVWALPRLPSPSLTSCKSSGPSECSPPWRGLCSIRVKYPEPSHRHGPDCLTSGCDTSGSVASVAVCAYMSSGPMQSNSSVHLSRHGVRHNVDLRLPRIAVKSVAKRNFIVRGWKAFVSTGMPGSIICILALVAGLWESTPPAVDIIALYFVLARVYSCTMLFTMHYPLPIRKSMIQDLVNTSGAQGTLLSRSPSPDIFLKSERGTQPKEGNVQSWYNIDLGDGAMRTSRSAPENTMVTAGCEPQKQPCIRSVEVGSVSFLFGIVGLVFLYPIADVFVLVIHNTHHRASHYE